MKVNYNELALEERYCYAGKAARASFTTADLYNMLRPQGLVLDLGCGKGLHTNYMVKRGCRVIPLDVSSVQLKPVNSLEKVCADANYLPFEDNTFDCVLCADLLEHMESPELVIREVYRVLRKDGSALFTTPCLNIPIKQLVTMYRKIANVKMVEGEHIHVFSTMKLESIIVPPFQLIEVKYKNYTSLMEIWFDCGDKLDDMLSSLTNYINPLHYLAGSNLIKVRKS